MNINVAKKNVYGKLVEKVDNIDTSGFALKTKYTAYKLDWERKISNANKKTTRILLVKKTNYNATIKDIESKIPNISGLAIHSALTAVEDKVPDISNLAKKTGYNAKITNSENKYIATADYKKFATNIVANSIKSKNLVNKSAIAGFINNANLDKR